jgi:hypothetical protein
MLMLNTVTRMRYQDMDHRPYPSVPLELLC